MRYYKIRNPKTDLYSTGGEKPRWSVRGKTWNNIGHLKAHLSLIRNLASSFYNTAEIVTLEMSVVERVDVTTVLKEVVERRLAEQRVQAERRAVADRETKERQYEQLKKELGK